MHQRLRCALAAAVAICGLVGVTACLFEDWDSTVGAACSSDAHCSDGETCQDGICTAIETGCTSNGDCATGQTCTDGECVTAAECTSNGDCGTGEECLSGVCSAAVTVVECTTNGDCAEGAECVGGQCVTPTETETAVSCTSNGDCPDGQECADGVCAAAATPCTTNGDCPDGQECQDGFCAVAVPAPSMAVLAETTRAPYVVRFDLRLKDADGQAITQDVTSDSFRVYENGRLLDYTETNQFVTAGESLPLKVVLVLDYSNSMAAADALDEMISAAQGFVQADYFTASHQIGVVEFHDRTDEGAGYSTAVPLTAADPAGTNGKVAIVEGIPAATEVEHGMSRVWDAVDLAMGMLADSGRADGEFQAVVFLTDGRDTTSEATTDGLLSRAETDNVALYAIGFDAEPEDEVILAKLAEQSGGQYFAAADGNDLDGIFGRIVDDLRGQWNLTYLTTRNSSTVDSRVEFVWEGLTAEYETSFDAGQLAGDVHQGVIEVPRRWTEADGSRTYFLLKAAYVPRDVDRFRFVFANRGVDFALQGAGGLTNPDDGWTLTADSATVFELRGTQALEYGAFGNIGVASVPGDVAALQVSHDDTVYEDLAQPKTIIFEGDSYVAPYQMAVTVDPEDAGVVVLEPVQATYALGDVVSLTAVAHNHYVFSNWIGDAAGTNSVTAVVMDESKEATAHFYPPRQLALSVSPVNGGTIGRSPSWIDYPHGSVVRLTAQPASGFVFNRWEGSATGTSSPLSLTMDGDKAVTATFYPPRTLIVLVQPAGGGTVTVTPYQAVYAHGTVVTLTAVPNATTFDRWSGSASGTSLSTTITMDADKTVTAVFH